MPCQVFYKVPFEVPRKVLYQPLHKKSYSLRHKAPCHTKYFYIVAYEESNEVLALQHTLQGSLPYKKHSKVP